MTLDRVPETLYSEVAANEAQRREWVDLFAIDEVAGYGEPPSAGFLTANPHLVLDTRHFDTDFRDRLLAALSDAEPLDEQTNGLLIHGENFQALNLLQARYAGKVQCVYIDPPFNTNDGDFCYKDNYQSSSWLSSMCDRIALSRRLMMQSGQLIVHIDENENENLHRLLEQLFDSENYLGVMIWNKRNPKGDAKGLAVQHESILWAIKDSTYLSTESNGLQRPKRNAASILDAARRFVNSSKTTDEARKKFSDWMKKEKKKNYSQGELAYKNLDDDGRVFRTVSMAWPNKKKAPDSYFISLVHPITGKACPVPKRGWRNTPSRMEELLKAGLIVFGPDETTQPERKYLLEQNMYENVSSVFDFGGSSDPEAQGLGISFDTMKPLALAKYLCNCDGQDTVLDYFAGSGTTGHAVIDINREDGGERTYVLVEMGDHFDTVVLPRLKKVAYSPDWKAGKPVARDKGVSHLIRYVRLESYEDTLDGLVLTPPSGDLLAGGTPALAEDYRLRYALGAETAASTCLMGGAFTNPFAYTLSIVRDGARRETSADLPETFNFLLGLRVESRRRLDGVLAIAGRDAEGRHCLILWRDLEATDNDSLEAWFADNRARLPDLLDLVYVNGDHTLNAIRQPGETWTAETIEPVFRELMFEDHNQ